MSGTVVRTTSAGVAVARWTKAIVMGQGSWTNALSYAEGQDWRTTPAVVTELRAAVDALGTGDLSTALPAPIAADFLSVVRPVSLVDRITGFRTVPLNVSVLKVTSGASAQLVGAGKPKPVSNFSLERVTVEPFKATSLVVVSRELMISSSPAAEVVLGKELARGIGQATDLAFIDPAAAPIPGESPGSVTNSAPTINSTGSSLAQISADLAAVIAAFADDRDESLMRANWVMAPTTATYLAQLRGSGGAPAYPDVGPRGGTLLQMPVFVTGAAYASGSPGESFAALVDPADILVGDSPRVQIKQSEQATLQMVTNPITGVRTNVSLWQNGLVALLAERWVGFQRAGDNAAVVLRNITF